MMISFVLHSHFHFPPSSLLPSLCISLSVPHSFTLSLLLTLCVSFCCHLALLSFVTVAVVVGVGVAVACGMWHSVRHFAIFIYGMQLLDASPLPRPPACQPASPSPQSCEGGMLQLGQLRVLSFCPFRLPQ